MVVAQLRAGLERRTVVAAVAGGAGLGGGGRYRRYRRLWQRVVAIGARAKRDQLTAGHAGAQEVAALDLGRLSQSDGIT